MRDPLTYQVETWLGSVFVLIVSAFLVGFFWIQVKNFESDTEIFNYSIIRIANVTYAERQQIDQWLANNKILPSVKEVGYRYIVKKYPDKPWLEK